MTELRFKLKRDGKCVGYLYTKRHFEQRYLELFSCGPDGPTDKDLAWRPGEHPLCDEMCPLVCQDRNGRDVYEGDRCESSGKAYRVVFRDGGFYLKRETSDFAIQGEPHFLTEACVSKYIELIEEQPPAAGQEQKEPRT